MKHFIYNIRFILSATFLMIVGYFSSTMQAAEDNYQADSVEVSLLTCEPHQKIYGLYGHTALRFHDKNTGNDWSFNYGVFNFDKPFFILRFMFGLTDYELGIVPMRIFKEEYERLGCRVTEQIINLTANEKARLFYMLQDNYRPENRVYRYNYFYDNCTTRARNIIEQCLEGKINYDGSYKRYGAGLSHREMIHLHTINHPWASVGNDLCLGFKADEPTNWRDAQFLPDNLMKAFDKAKIVNFDGTKRPLVSETRIIVKGKPQATKKEFPLLPSACAIILLAITIIITLTEIKRHKAIIAYDIVLMTIQGLVGIIITAMLFSEHPTTSTNLQALILNPLPLAFVWSVGKGYKNCYWKISALLTILFLMGALVQCYAEGMIFVALCLLLRNGMHIYGFHTLGIKDNIQEKTKKKK